MRPFVLNSKMNSSPWGWLLHFIWDCASCTHICLMVLGWHCRDRGKDNGNTYRRLTMAFERRSLLFVKTLKRVLVAWWGISNGYFSKCEAHLWPIHKSLWKHNIKNICSLLFLCNKNVDMPFSPKHNKNRYMCQGQCKLACVH